jgi:hypothetical protein
VNIRAVLARELALDALAASGASLVPGAEDWARTGDGRLLARRWREILTSSAERIEQRLALRVRVL